MATFCLSQIAAILESTPPDIATWSWKLSALTIVGGYLCGQDLAHDPHKEAFVHCLAMYIVGESVLNSAVYESILGSKHFEAFDPQKFRAEQLRSKPRKLYLGSRRP